jgi:hypothetical protein
MVAAVKKEQIMLFSEMNKIVTFAVHLNLMLIKRIRKGKEGDKVLAKTTERKM